MCIFISKNLAHKTLCGFKKQHRFYNGIHLFKFNMAYVAFVFVQVYRTFFFNLINKDGEFYRTLILHFVNMKIRAWI